MLPFDGRRALQARRVLLKPFFLPRDLPFFKARAKGKL